MYNRSWAELWNVTGIVSFMPSVTSNLFLGCKKRLSSEIPSVFEISRINCLCCTLNEKLLSTPLEQMHFLFFFFFFTGYVSENSRNILHILYICRTVWFGVRLTRSSLVKRPSVLTGFIAVFAFPPTQTGSKLLSIPAAVLWTMYHHHSGTNTRPTWHRRDGETPTEAAGDDASLPPLSIWLISSLIRPAETSWAFFFSSTLWFCCVTVLPCFQSGSMVYVETPTVNILLSNGAGLTFKCIGCWIYRMWSFLHH